MVCDVYVYTDSLCVHAWVCILRHLHAILWAPLVIIWVWRGGVRGELVLPLRCDGDVTTLQVPDKQKYVQSHTMHMWSFNRHRSWRQTTTLTWWHYQGSWSAGRSGQYGLCRGSPQCWLQYCLWPAEGLSSPSDAPLGSFELALLLKKKGWKNY